MTRPGADLGHVPRLTVRSKVKEDQSATRTRDQSPARSAAPRATGRAREPLSGPSEAGASGGPTGVVVGEVVDPRREGPAGTGLDAPDLSLPRRRGERLARSHVGVVGVERLAPPCPPLPPGGEHASHDIEPAPPDERLRLAPDRSPLPPLVTRGAAAGQWTTCDEAPPSSRPPVRGLDRPGRPAGPARLTHPTPARPAHPAATLTANPHLDGITEPTHHDTSPSDTSRPDITTLDHPRPTRAARHQPTTDTCDRPADRPPLFEHLFDTSTLNPAADTVSRRPPPPLGRPAPVPPVHWSTARV